MNNILSTNNISNVFEGKQILYHGTIYDIPQDGIELDECRKDTDFGQGFYLTTIRKQAEEWALRQYLNLNKRYKKVNAKKSRYIQENLIQLEFPVLIPYKIEKNKATLPIKILQEYEEPEDKNKNIYVKKFETNSTEWTKFVLDNRSRNILSLKYNGYGKYDIVIGPVADGNNLKKIVEDYKEYNKKRQSDNKVTEPDFKTIANDLTYRKKYNNQYSFHTNDALKMLTKFEPIYLKNVSKICKESTYFDYEELKLFEYSLPLIIRNIVLLLSEDKGYSTFKAEEIFYKTQTYELLQDIETGLYEEDPYFIYETMLQDEMKYGYIIQREF